jgi:hypothetical protein
MNRLSPASKFSDIHAAEVTPPAFCVAGAFGTHSKKATRLPMAYGTAGERGARAWKVKREIAKKQRNKSKSSSDFVTFASARGPYESRKDEF